MKPSGIGGWLILPAIGLVLTPILTLLTIVRDVLPAVQPAVWQTLTDPASSAYHPMWATVIVYEVLANVGYLALTLWLGYLFVSKSPRTPAVCIVWLLTSLAVQIVDMMLSNTIPAVAQQSATDNIKGIFRSAVQASIWIPYFVYSKRVRNTFTAPGSDLEPANPGA
ncbi:MAG TPA: DUF2569 domain-containing protein [Steroidobacteraceae bacterium]|jgi:ABC-type polysaccharide transport system permease subunit